VDERQFEEAVARMVQGDKSGLKEIYENYAGYIYRIIYEVLRNKENTEDVTSEFFIRLWSKAGQFKPGGGHRGYLAVMARNMAVDFLRKYRREELTSLLQDLGREPGEEDPHGNYLSGEIFRGSLSYGSLSHGKNSHGKISHGKGFHPGNTYQGKSGFKGGDSEVEREVLGHMTVREALETLKPAERQIVSLKVLGELTFKEIAQCMQIPMGTVTWKYQNAIKKLRRCGYE